MANRDSKTQNGFTILEVIIVMAIAGMILLLVFQVIPTLMRNSRNGQRRADVATILEAISHYELNNGGSLPSGFNQLNDLLGTTKLTYYSADTGSISFPYVSRPTKSTAGPVGSTDKVEIFNYQRCDNDIKGKSKYQGAGYDDIVALYAIETSGGSAGECQQL